MAVQGEVKVGEDVSCLSLFKMMEHGSMAVQGEVKIGKEGGCLPLG